MSVKCVDVSKRKYFVYLFFSKTEDSFLNFVGVKFFLNIDGTMYLSVTLF
jgi:hypothetical protein